MGTLLFHRWATPAAFAIAVAAWVAVSALCYCVAWTAGYGADEQDQAQAA
jgi:hypothetical protein